MGHESSNKTYDFRKFKTMRAFGNEIILNNRNNIIDLDEASYEQNQLLNYIKELNKNKKPRDPELKKIKENVFNGIKKHLKAEYFRALKNHHRVKELKY